MKTKIVELAASDIPIILNLGRLTYTDPKDKYTDYAWFDWFNEGMKTWGLKTTDGELIAIGSINFYNKNGAKTLYSQADIATLTNGQVHPRYRGCGYQHKLIRKRINFILSNRIYDILSFVKNDSSVSAYNLKRNGFRLDGSVKDDDGSIIYRFAYNNKPFVYFYKIRNYLEELNFYYE